MKFLLELKNLNIETLSHIRQKDYLTRMGAQKDMTLFTPETDTLKIVER